MHRTHPRMQGAGDPRTRCCRSNLCSQDTPGQHTPDTHSPGPAWGDQAPKGPPPKGGQDPVDRALARHPERPSSPPWVREKV